MLDKLTTFFQTSPVPPQQLADSLWLIIALPLLGAFVCGVFGRALGRGNTGLIACMAVAGSFALSVLAFWSIAERSTVAPVPFRDPVNGIGHALGHDYGVWFSAGDFRVDLGLWVDHLSGTMLLVITGVGLLIHIYSTAYMEHDPGFGRYFAYLLSSLLLLVGYVMAAFTDRKRALHDMICSTLVVDRWAYTAHPERQRQDLWPDDHPVTGHKWGMVVDLNACTGCSACVVACQAENNTPVVGRDEVRRQREMHWLRIDRYFTDAGEDVDVVHQPMMCQHCANASCESVCPVLATVHSDEGLSEQVYNRCVGTRYCANNCPYKVRRFNWFTYARPDERENLVLNPDVVVRTRGVMEKCSLCVQRIQESKIGAKQRGARVVDGDVQTACEQSCPSHAIVFGDLNDPKSRIATLVKDGRYFRVLEELNERPNVGYLAVVRNRAAASGETRHD